MSPSALFFSSADALTRRRALPSFARNTRQPTPDLSIRRLLRQHAWKYRRELLLAVMLNAIPGLGVAMQTLAPKYLIDSVFAQTALSPNQRVFRLCALLAIYLASALI